MNEEFVFKGDSDLSSEDMKVINDAVAFIGNLTTGNPVTEIGRYLSLITGVKYLMIGRFVLPNKDKVKTVCFFNYGQQLDNITYDMENTPCQGVFSHRACYYPFGIQEEFPKDADLVILGVSSYMGIALRDYSGNSIGLVVLLHDKPIENPGLIDNLMNIISPTLERNLAE